MQITICDKCDVVVDHSRDERRFKPHYIVDDKAICEDCNTEIVNNKDAIIGNIYDDLFPWINDGIAEIQKKFGMDNGDVSPSLDMEFREVYERLAECVYKQLQEHNKIESEVNNG